MNRNHATRGQMNVAAPFALTVVFLVFVAVTVAVPMIQDTLATANVGTAQKILAGFLSAVFILGIFLVSVGPLLGRR